MSAPAAIMASLVDVRNVAAHRCVRLEIHVPVEQAPEVMRCFGWPTAADPVPVAIARIVPEAAQRPALPQQSPNGKARRPFHELPYAQQAALKSQDKDFQHYLGVHNEAEAADWIRKACGVKSRAEIEGDPRARDRWIQALRGYEDYAARGGV